MGCNYITVELPDQKGEGMVFSSMMEADYAHQQGVIALHAKIKVRLPNDRKLKTDDPNAKKGAIIQTTFGRILFNSILPPGMDFYNMSLKSSDLASVISDCYQRLGRRATIKLLDDMNQLGFRESTRSGLSFGADDLVTPDSKAKHIADADKKVMAFQKNYLKGVMTAQERYNQVLDAWTHTRELITKDMLQAMENDTHRGNWYINPVFLMASSGARGGIEQIRQLAGMRGLMAKPTGEIIEAPIKSNFREGLGVLEYFSSTHGARKGLADTALKTADSGYLTRKLADVAQNVVITMNDCGTTQSVTKGVIYRGEKVEVRLTESITGRVSRQNIVNLITSETIVEENQLITRDIARRIEEMGLEKIQVRSPMTCDAPLGICRNCYGMDMSTGALVEEGMAVGIIAAQSIGEPGTQLTMRTFHIGGTVNTNVEESDIKAKKAGIVKFIKMRFVRNDDGHDVVLTRNCEIALVDARGREIERYEIPAGARLSVQENQEIAKGAQLCEWNPHKIPILSTASGKIVFVDIIEGETMRLEKDPSGNVRRRIMDARGKFHPQIVIEDADGKALDVHYLPDKAVINCIEGKKVNAGTELAEMPREATGVKDITGGLPRVTEIFEARKPKDPAVVAEIDGTVEISKDRKRGKRSIVVRSESGEEVEHLVPPGKRFLVHSGDVVKAGQPLIEGPLVPHDILRVSGEEAVQSYLVHEVQQVYRSQRVDINDKHIEIIAARMLRKVKITNPGDTNLLSGLVLDRFEFKRHNDHLAKCVKITDPGDTEFALGAIVPREALETSNAQCEALGGKPAKGKKPKPAHGEVQLLGITKAAVQSNSFISAASFQETTKVLTEAALAGKVDRLVGLKENVILGHLIPAGTGFRVFQDSEVSYRKEALEDLVNRGTAAAEQSFPLLNEAPRPQTTQPESIEPVSSADIDVPMSDAPLSDSPASDAPISDVGEASEE